MHFPKSILFSAGILLLCVTAICQPAKNGPAPTHRSQAQPATQSRTYHGIPFIQGDIIKDKTPPDVIGGVPRPQMFGISSPSSLWPPVSGVATVYYVNANAGATDSIDEAANANIATAINTFNADFTGVIQWVVTTPTSGVNYVLIDLDPGDFSGECEAAEGYEAEKAQPMGGSAQCTVGTILHEMGHIIGLWHEQSRPDAANYVTINYNNVIKGSWGNFETITQNAQVLGLYDYASVMQYMPYAFSRNGGPVIETIPAGMPLSNAEGVPVPANADYSSGDKEAIERLYGAPPTTITVTSNPVGLVVEVDGTNVTTPHIFNWALNSTHTLNVASNAQTLTGDIEDSTTSATFYYNFGRWNDNGAQSHIITVSPGDGAVGFPASSPQVATYSANFIELVPYTSSIYPTGTGTALISPTPQSYPGVSGSFLIARQQATLTASPNSGWSFYEFNNGPFWLPGGLGANPKTFYVPDTGNPIDTTVEFTNAPVYTVDVTPETFSSNLYVYVDGDYYQTPKIFSPYEYYDTTWTSGSSHTLAFNSPESPYSLNSNYVFSNWSDGGAASHTISSLPAGNTSYLATITPEFMPATNFSYPPCGGTGAISPSSGFIPSGQMLTYTATPTSSWVFAGWTFDLSGTTNPASLTANDETLVFANFNTTNVPLTLTSLSPASANSGGSSLTLTLTGTGFTADSNVIVNGTNRAILNPTAQSMQVQLTSADLASPGALQVAVENYPSGWSGCAVFGYQTFLVHSSTLATSTLVSSSSNPSAQGSNVIFSATVSSPEENATGSVTFKDGASTLGTGTLNASGVATYSTSALAVGSHTIAAVYGGDSYNTGSTSATFTQTVKYVAATMSSPASGSTFSGASVTFNWNTASAATGYALWIGTTGVGSHDLLEGGIHTTTSLTFTSMPVNGEPIYVRLYTSFNGTLVSNDYTYTAATGEAIMTSPTPGSTFNGPSATFTWSTATGAAGYALWIGTTGVGSHNLLQGGIHTTTSLTFSSLPTNGGTVYIRLYTSINGTLVSVDYTYTAVQLAAITSPTPMSTLTGPSATFVWSTANGASGYALWIGTTGVGSHNLLEGGIHTVTSQTVSTLPTAGGTIYMRLYTSFNGTLLSNDYTFTEATQATMTSPTPMSAFTGSSETFTWTAGLNAAGYALWLGTTGAGSHDLLEGGIHTATSLTVNGLPTNAETIYARLYTSFNGALVFIDYTYTAAP